MTRLGFAFRDDPVIEFTRRPEGDSGPYRRMASEIIQQCNETIDSIARLLDDPNPRRLSYPYTFSAIDLVGKGKGMLCARIDQEISWLTRRDGFSFWAAVLRCDHDQVEQIHERMLDRAMDVRARLRSAP